MATRLNVLAAADPDRLITAEYDTDGSSAHCTRVQFNDRVNRLTNALIGAGVRPGDTIGVLAGNSIDFVVVLMAASLMEVSQVPVNWHLAPEEVAYILETSRTRLLVADEQHAATARRSARQAGVEHLWMIGADLDGRLAEAAADEPDERRVASAIFFTAGTTGRPKATRMAEMRVATDVDEMAEVARRQGGDESQRNLILGPLYHGGPLIGAVRSIVLGSELHIMRRYDAELALELIDRVGITNTTGVPTHFVRMLQLPPETRARYDVSSIVRAHHIGAIMPPEVKERMIGWWGPVLVDAYGCTELGTIARITSEEWQTRRGSVGRPLDQFSLHIRDESEEELPPGEVGVIWIESHGEADIVYLDDPDRTEACHRSPTEFTLFDLGYVDDDGYLYLVDRRVDLIISGGVNIYPAEVESVLVMHPDVVDIGVFAVPDDEWGHAVMAAVQLRDGVPAGTETESAIIDWASERMANYKLPRSIDFVDSLPRTTAGKIQRRVLREPYWPAEAP